MADLSPELDANRCNHVVCMWLRIPDSRCSDTVVLEATFHIFQWGCLRIQEIGGTNIKRAKALRHLAFWLQQLLSLRWRATGKLHGPLPEHYAKAEGDIENCILVVGAAGTGKTTVAKVEGAFAEFFFGVDCLSKAAMTNTAARLFGGDA